jgi:hypothetical protein
MPIHDWQRVMAGTFHHFHQLWIAEICNALNGGLLPAGYYALADQVAGGPHPDVLTLEAAPEFESADEDEPFGFAGGATAVMTAVAGHPPQLRYTLEAEEAIYAAKADRIAVCHASGDRVVAFLEIISPGNKHSELAVKQLIDKLSRALARGCHLLLIDLFPPGRHDPQGLHAELWGKPDPILTAEEPLWLAAYRAAASPVAYLEPTAIGRTLINMPLFLTDEHYINVPLEQTYMAAWKGVPDRWKQVIEPASAK